MAVRIAECFGDSHPARRLQRPASPREGGQGGRLRFQWNGVKARANSRRHGVAFEEAITVFLDPLAATVPVPAHSENEHRFVTIGYAATGRLLLVCHTPRHGSERIVSARLATRHERRRYEEQD